MAMQHPMHICCTVRRWLVLLSWAWGQVRSGRPRTYSVFNAVRCGGSVASETNTIRWQGKARAQIARYVSIDRKREGPT